MTQGIHHPAMSSLAAECNDAKKKYDDCFLTWYTAIYMRSPPLQQQQHQQQQEEEVVPCREQLHKYHVCLQVADWRPSKTEESHACVGTRGICKASCAWDRHVETCQLTWRLNQFNLGLGDAMCSSMVNRMSSIAAK